MGLPQRPNSTAPYFGEAPNPRPREKLTEGSTLPTNGSGAIACPRWTRPRRTMAAQLGRAVANGSFRRFHRSKFPAGTLATLPRAKCFGYLQNSVWITLDPLDEERKILGGGRIDLESLLLLAGRPCAGESDSKSLPLDGTLTPSIGVIRHTSKFLGSVPDLRCGTIPARKRYCVAPRQNATHGSTP
jgi:hypothetical protein